MKLQKQISRKIGKTIYYKWILTIPLKIIKKVKWKKGEEIEAIVIGNKIILKQKK